MTKPRKASHSSSSSSSSHKSSTTVSRKEPTTIPVKEEIAKDEDDFNSGFGSYLRSDEGVGMMKLFVIANSIMTILTMAFPSMKELYKMIHEMLFDEERL